MDVLHSLVFLILASGDFAFISESPLVHKKGFTWSPGKCTKNSPKTSKGSTTDACLALCTGSCKAISWNRKTKACVTHTKACSASELVSIADENENHYIKFAHSTQVKWATGQTSFNLAYRKPSAQSRTKDPSYAELATDGNRDNKDGKSCAIAYKDAILGYSWWYVDLGAGYEVDVVTIASRQVAKTMAARNFKIFITDHFDAYDVYKYRNNFTLCGKQGNAVMKPGEVKAFKCQYPKMGQYVVIIKHPVWEELELCEVEVYGTNTFRNVALQNPASHYPAGTANPATRAADGILNPLLANGGCTESGKTTTPMWWEVDLGCPYNVRNIFLFNRGDSKGKNTGDFHIQVDNKVCSYVSGKLADGDVKKYSCYRRTVGRLMRLEKRSVEPLSFCELEVYGHQPDKNVAYLKPIYTLDKKSPDKRATDGSTHPHLACSKANSAAGKEAEFLIIDLISVHKLRYFVLAFGATQAENVYIYAFKEIKDATWKGTTGNTVGGELCTRHAGVIPKETILPMYCLGGRQVVGRYIYIWKKTKGTGKLEICEVEAYGEVFDGDLAHNKPTNQSSVFSLYKPALAVDGNEDTRFGRGTCSQTLTPKTGQAWWSVDLGAKFDIHRLTLVNADKCKDTCLRQYKVLVSNSSNIDNVIDKSDHVVCYDDSAKLKDGESKTVLCKPGSIGQHVVIATTGRYPLTLCEVKVYESGRLVNAALRKPASHKGNKFNHKAPAHAAVDGLSYTWFKSGTCSMSCGSGEDEWWSVDLRSRHRVYLIKLVSTKDKGGFLENFEVNVAEAFDPRHLQKALFYPCTTQQDSLGYGKRKYIRCQALATGRHVVVLKKRPSYVPIVLCEVEVYGLPIWLNAENVAHRKTAKQTSNYKPWSTADKAVDGNTSPSYFRGSCAITAGTVAKEWWVVNLGDMFDVDKIGIITKSFNGPNLHFQHTMTVSAGKKYPDAPSAARVMNVAQPTWVGTLNQDNEYDCQNWCQELDFCLGVTWDKTKKSCGVHLAASKTATASTGHNYYKKTGAAVTSTDKAAYFNDVMAGVLRTYSTGTAVKDSVWFPCYEKTTTTSPGDIIGATCPQGAFGQHVIIIKNGANGGDGPLALCEVEVFGRATMFTDPITANKTASHISTKLSNSADRAVDGKMATTMTGGTCSQTGGIENNEWWSVDMLEVYNVTNVMIIARGDCCAAALTGFTIIVSDTFSDILVSSVFSRSANATLTPALPPGSNTGFKYHLCQENMQMSLKNGQSFMARCKKNAVGRHLTIVKHKSKGSPLDLCEVEAFGKKIVP